MSKRWRGAWLVVMLASGCKSEGAPSAGASASVAPTQKESSAPPSASAKAPPPPKGVKVTLAGKEYAFDHAWVYSANGMVVRLSTHPWNCSGDLDKAAAT